MKKRKWKGEEEKSSKGNFRLLKRGQTHCKTYYCYCLQLLCNTSKKRKLKNGAITFMHFNFPTCVGESGVGEEHPTSKRCCFREKVCKWKSLIFYQRASKWKEKIEHCSYIFIRVIGFSLINFQCMRLIALSPSK